jgi:hypothetical protein
VKRAAIRFAVSKHLASLGYSNAWYGWFQEGRKIVLGVHHPKTFKRTTYHLPSGRTTKKRLAEVLAGMPACGPAREAALIAARDDGGGGQLSMLSDAR